MNGTKKPEISETSDTVIRWPIARVEHDSAVFVAVLTEVPSTWNREKPHAFI
jgi:hypothetical protein